MPDELIVEFKNVSKSYEAPDGGVTNAIREISFQVPNKPERGEFVSLLGPSGCGKTTLLRIVAGLLGVDRGSVKLDGQDITALPPHKRDVGVVFQNYALFPHLSVAENVAFGLKARGRGAGETREAVARFLDLVHLADFADRSVRALSGGQQQRVAVARALAVRPKLLLLDEPFSALDRKLRETMQIDLRRLLRELGTTSVFVTHDQDEALTMSDRIAVMNRGAIEQLDTPEAIYRRPATAFALEFVGLSSRLAGTVLGTENGLVTVDTAFGRLVASGNFIKGAPVLRGLRTLDGFPPFGILVSEGKGAGGLRGLAPWRSLRQRLMRASRAPLLPHTVIAFPFGILSSDRSSAG